MWRILHVLPGRDASAKKHLESGPADVGSSIIFAFFSLNLALEHNMIGRLELDTMLMAVSLGSILRSRQAYTP